MPRETLNLQEKITDPELLRLMAEREELHRRKERRLSEREELQKEHEAAYKEAYGARAVRALRRKIGMIATMLSMALLQPKRTGDDGMPAGATKKEKTIPYEKPKSRQPKGTTVRYPAGEPVLAGQEAAADAVRLPDILAPLTPAQLNELTLTPEETAALTTVSISDLPQVRAEHEADTVASVPSVTAEQEPSMRDTALVSPIPGTGPELFDARPTDIAPAERTTDFEAPLLSGEPVEIVPVTAFPETRSERSPKERDASAMIGRLRKAAAKKAGEPGRITVEYDRPEDDPANNPSPKRTAFKRDTIATAGTKEKKQGIVPAPGRSGHFPEGYVDTTPTGVSEIYESEYPAIPLDELTEDERRIYDRTYRTKEADHSTDTSRTAIDRKITKEQEELYMKDRETTYKMVPVYDAHGNKIGERQVIDQPFHKGFGELASHEYTARDPKQVKIEGGFVVPGVLDALIHRPTWKKLQAYGLEAQRQYLKHVESKEDAGSWFYWAKDKGVVLIFTHDNKLAGEHPILGGMSVGDALNTYTTAHAAEGMTTPAGDYLIRKATKEDLAALKGQFGHAFHKDLWIMLMKTSDGRWLNQGIAIHGELVAGLEEQEKHIHSADASKHGETIGCGRLTADGLKAFKKLFKGTDEGGQEYYAGHIGSAQRGMIRLPDGTMAHRTDEQLRQMMQGEIGIFEEHNPVEMQVVREEIVEKSRKERSKEDSYVRDPKAENKIRLEVKRVDIKRFPVPKLGESGSDK